MCDFFHSDLYLKVFWFSNQKLILLYCSIVYHCMTELYAFIHSPVNGQLFCSTLSLFLQLLVLMNFAAINIFVQAFLRACIFTGINCGVQCKYMSRRNCQSLLQSVVSAPFTFSTVICEDSICLTPSLTLGFANLFDYSLCAWCHNRECDYVLSSFTHFCAVISLQLCLWNWNTFEYNVLTK